MSIFAAFFVRDPSAGTPREAAKRKNSIHQNLRDKSLGFIGMIDKTKKLLVRKEKE
jgi:hypothetical protein